MAEIILAPYEHPPPGTPEGDRLRDQFVGDLLDLFGDTRLLWIPKTGDTTSTTESSRNADVLTYDATIASRFSVLGSGYAVEFDGTDDEADTADSPIHSFGDSAADQAFSVVALVNPDTDTSAQTLISKQNSATVDEWELHLTATNGYATFDLIDASSSGIIGRSYDTDVGTSDTLLVATYDGSRAATGIRIYQDAARVDDGTGGSTGTYTAMENGASLVRLGNRYTTSERFYNGKMALAAIVGRELDIDDNWALKTLVKAFYDLPDL